MANTNTKYEDFEKRIFFKFLKDKVFKLLGLSPKSTSEFNFYNNQKEEIDCMECAKVIDEKTWFGFKGKSKMLFYINAKPHNVEDINWVSTIIEAFQNIIDMNRNILQEGGNKGYIYDKTEQNHEYIRLSDSYASKYENQLFDFAIERGIINWINPLNPASTLRMERLFDILNNWSEKTYEGHKVCFGFLVETNKHETPKYEYQKYRDSFLDFLKDEYAATLSDGITSLIRIDSNGNFKNYESLLENDTIKECDFKDSLIPYRFVQIINSKVVNDTIGLFLLQNGDIIIAKEQKIFFIKRNGNWLNFQFSSFENIINSKLNKKYNETFYDLMKQTFASCLDVSLAHTGGIISVISEKKLKELKKITSPIDMLDNNYSEEALYYYELNKKADKKAKILDSYSIDMQEEITKKVKEKYPDEFNKITKDIRKRLTKRFVIKSLISKNDQPLKFTKIDRKLRSELIGMDGATIVDNKGNIISFGAIITNEAGSSGGGRGSAAKRLSTYGGYSIKISTDGYIELYIQGNINYSIK
jgi:hypothetical protein